METSLLRRPKRSCRSLFYNCGTADSQILIPSTPCFPLTTSHAAIAGRALDPNFDATLLKRATEALRAEELSHDVARALIEELQLEAARE